MKRASESGARGLEVDIDLGYVAACQIGRAAHEIGECRRNRHGDKLRQLAKCLDGVWGGCFPSFQKFFKIHECALLAPWGMLCVHQEINPSMTKI